MKSPRRVALVSLGLFAALLGCSDSTEPKGYSVQFGALPYWLEQGDTFRIRTVVVHQDQPGQALDTVPGVRITWTSTNPLVATVDTAGVVTARGSGSTFIMASIGGGSTGFELYGVTRIASLRFAADSVSLVPFDRMWVIPTPVDASGSPVFAGIPVSWEQDLVLTIGDVTILEPDPDRAGLVTGSREGLTQITTTLRGRTGALTVAVQGLEFTQIVTGASYGCGVTDDARTYCWGAIVGQFGGISEWWHPVFVPREVLPRTALTTLTGGAEHVCGLDASGEAYCWGSNIWGQLGTIGQPLGVSVVPGGHHFSTIAAGAGHTCALEIDGTLYCWGQNGAGQLGVDSGAVCGTGGKFTIAYFCRPQPTVVPGAPSFVALSAGQEHSCGLIADGHAYCWGRIFGSPTSIPRVVGSPEAFTTVASGAGHACGLTAGGAAYCWGYNLGGLGDGSTTASGVAVAVAGGPFRQLSGDRGQSYYPGIGISLGTCGVTTGDVAQCWGGTGVFASAIPTPVVGAPSFASVSVGSAHACGFGLDGFVYCWGYNETGAVGVPELVYQATPRRVVAQH